MRLVVILTTILALVCISSFCGNRRESVKIASAATTQSPDSLKDRALRLRMECDARVKSLEATVYKPSPQKIHRVSASEAIHYQTRGNPPE